MKVIKINWYALLFIQRGVMGYGIFVDIGYPHVAQIIIIKIETNNLNFLINIDCYRNGFIEMQQRIEISN